MKWEERIKFILFMEFIILMIIGMSNIIALAGGFGFDYNVYWTHTLAMLIMAFFIIDFIIPIAEWWFE